jgi:hypothetical protein
MFVAMFDDVLARCRGKKGAGRRFVESAKHPDSSVADASCWRRSIGSIVVGAAAAHGGWMFLSRKKPVVWYRTLHSALASSPFPFPPRAIPRRSCRLGFFFLEDPGSRWMAALS